MTVNRSNQREIDGGAFARTTGTIIGAGIVAGKEKNDRTHSTLKMETVDQLENRNSIFRGNHRENHVNNNNNNKNNNKNNNNKNNNKNNNNKNNNNKQQTTMFPTFATRFNFPKETTSLPESTTPKVDVEKLEKQLLDVLDRLAESYTESTDSR